MTDDLPWPVEDLPDPDALFLRLHRQYFRENELQPSVFQDRGPGMSTNWSRYCLTPADCQLKARIPADNGVGRLVVADVRSLPLDPLHKPSTHDRSHVTVFGKKTTEVRVKLLGIVAIDLVPT